MEEDKEEEEEEHGYMNKSRNSMWLRSSRVNEPNRNYDEIFDYGDLNNDQAPPSDLLRRSTRMRSGNFMNFDIDNSRINGLSGIFGQEMFRTNSRGLFPS